jgi:3-oxoacyl-[acyl-carrier protein] reductase
MLQKALPYLEKSNSGRILFMSSAGARTGSTGEGLAYTTAKGAIASMTYCVAKFLKNKGITVNCISPDGIGNDNNELQEEEKKILTKIAATVICLLGEQAKYITGKMMDV